MNTSVESLPASSSSMGSMPMSTSAGSSSSSPMTIMSMLFTNDHNTPLYSKSWTPSTTGGYASTCIFLILLAILGRLLVAAKSIMERKWLAAALDRRYVAIAGRPTEASIIEDNREAKKAMLISAQGVEQSVKVVQRTWEGPQPWRLSVDLPRAFLFLTITGVGYLLYV